MRNIQVPAYCPIVFGVQAEENNGVPVEVKNTIAIESMPIIMSEDIEDIGIELAVELDIAIPDIVAVGDVDVDVDIAIPLMLELMSIMSNLESNYCTAILSVAATSDLMSVSTQYRLIHKTTENLFKFESNVSVSLENRGLDSVEDEAQTMRDRWDKILRE